MESANSAATGLLATLLLTLKAFIHACIAVPVVVSIFHPRRTTTMPAVATGTAVQTTRTINADLFRFMEETANIYAAHARVGRPFTEIVGTSIPCTIDDPHDIDLVLWAAELGHSEGAFVRAAGRP
jgi:hypothetical protein